MTIRPVLVNLDSLDPVVEGPEERLVARLIDEAAEFECRRSPYHENFLRSRAAEHSRRNTSKTYLVLDGETLERFVGGEEGGRPLLAAYFTIALSSVNPASAQGASGKARKRIGEHIAQGDGGFVLCTICAIMKADGLPASVVR